MSVSYIKNSSFSAFENAVIHFNGLVEKLQSDAFFEGDLSQIEQFILMEGNEVNRLLLQASLEMLTNDEDKCTIFDEQGEHLNHVIPNIPREISTLFGSVVISRIGYQQRKKSRVYPMDEKLKLGSNKYSDGLKQRVLKQVVNTAYDNAVEQIESTTGARVNKRQMQNIAKEVSVDFDEFYDCRARHIDVDCDDLLVISTDGKGINMCPNALRAPTAKAARQPKLKTRLSPGEKTNKKRMAQVNTVYDVGRNPRTPEMIMQKNNADSNVKLFPIKIRNKRVWASIEKDAKTNIDTAFREAKKRDPNQTREWVFLVDGNIHQLNTIKKLRTHYHVKGMIVMDFIHVLEYLWSAGWELFAKNDPKIETWVEQKAIEILRGKAGRVAQSLGLSAYHRKLKNRKNIDACIRYLKNNKGHLQYDKALALGYPIATGVIEGACRHLIKDRFDITGARWSLDGAEAMLKLRSLKSSGDLNEYLVFHKEKEMDRLYSGFTDARR